jgi:glycosyltransferase involved in cell wall biosynthesis
MATSALRSAARPIVRRAAAALTRRWPPHSHLFLVGEGTDWVIDHELRALADTARSLGVPVADRRLVSGSSGQSVFYGSQFTLLGGRWSPPPHRLGVAYFHGLPGTPGMPEFDSCYRSLCVHREGLHRVQVSHSEIEALVLGSGIDSGKVFRIPIGIEPSYFEAQTPERRTAARAELGLPRGAFVVGSFHKDGVGWREGLEPKAIKGPDVLLGVLRAVRESVPELHVVLSGPARGYVRTGLERLGIPYVHRSVDRYAEIGRLYAALDAYVVPSRQEGGPKGLLEAMACGVPVVTTRVGQAMDLVRSGENAWMVDVDDAAGLAHWLGYVAEHPAELPQVIAAGLETAAANTYEAQLPLWRSFFQGFVEAP